VELTIDVLRRVSFLRDVKDRELKSLLKGMRTKTFAPGETIVEQGDTGGIGFYIVLDGTAEVSADGAARGKVAAGEHFGELGLLEEHGRTATVTATTEVTCAVLTAWEFKAMLREHPDMAWEVMRTMARRIARDEASSAG